VVVDNPRGGSWLRGSYGWKGLFSWGNGGGWEACGKVVGGTRGGLFFRPAIGEDSFFSPILGLFS
jgi:hypothetical protein